MAGEPLRLGPFIGGLNTGSDPTAIADAELAVCKNFELDIDGSLVSRPPMVELRSHIDVSDNLLTIGEATFSGTHYLFVSCSHSTFSYDGINWSKIFSGRATIAIQYANNVYFITHPTSAVGGGKWSPSTGFTTVAALPKGQAAVIHKERLFIVPGIDATTDTSRLHFSEPGDFESFPSSNFIDISQGDGSNLIDLTVYQDNLLLFKNNATFVLAYDVRPADAVLRNISLTIGVTSQHCITNYENQIYIFHNGWVYELINYDFNRLNTKVPFIKDETAPSPFGSESIFISLLEDRIICRYYKNVYVFGLRTRTWSQWEGEKDVLHYFGPITTIHDSIRGNKYYAGSSILAFTSLIQLYDKQSTTVVEKTLDPDYTIIDNFDRTVTNGLGGNWILNSNNTQYSVDGTKALIKCSTADFAYKASIPGTYLNMEAKVDVSVPSIPTGASGWLTGSILARYQDAANHYQARLEFTETSSLGISIYKIIGGVATLLQAATVGTYTAGTSYTLKFRVNINKLMAKAWQTTVTEPTSWNIELTDSSISASGIFGIEGKKAAGNTDVNPVVNFDNFKAGDYSTSNRMIYCVAKTKNFDMSVSHQFKRLWWWGADVTSYNEVIGTASPIVLSFKAKWGDLKTKKWGELNTWGQPLTEINVMETIVPTGTGTSRRFIKFLKSLRFRQINFSVKLSTDGSIVDGPARLFTILVVAALKQVVPKAVN